jgi:hypothetical protein
MKKIIQITSFLFIALIFSAVAAKAQSTERFKAEIPFVFSVGQKVYEPGRYTVKVTKSVSTDVILTILDNDGKVMKSVLVQPLNETGGLQSTFIFVTEGNDHSLSKILTSQSAYGIPLVNKKHRISMAAKI